MSRDFRHYTLSGGSDPSTVRTACGWTPKDVRPLGQQLAVQAEAYDAAITSEIFSITCPECRKALKKRTR